MKWVLFCCAIVTAAFAPAAASASQCSLLLDVSGSMRGFEHPSHSFQDFLNRLQDVCSDGYIFGSPNPLVPNSGREETASGDVCDNRWPYLATVGRVSEQPFNNLSTHLGCALQRWSSGHPLSGSAIVVTDNIADDQDENSARDQKLFNRVVGANDVHHLSVIPARFPFEGTVCNLKVPRPDCNHYGGLRAVAVYVIRKDNSAEFDALIQDVYAIVRQYSPKSVLIPFRNVGGVVGPQTRFSNATADLTDVPVEIESKPDGRQTLHFRDHHLDQSLTITIPITFQSATSWKLTAHPRVRLEYHAPQASTLTPIHTEVRLTPNSALQLSAGVPVTRNIVLPLGAMDYRANVDLGSVLDQLLRNSHVSGSGRLVVDMNYSDYHLSDDVSGEWDYQGSSLQLADNDDRIQGQIYHLGEVTRAILAKSLSLDSGRGRSSIDIVSDSILPLWPLYVIIIVGCCGLAGLGILLFYLGRRRDFDVTDDSGYTRHLELGFGAAATVNSAGGDAWIRIRRLVFAIYVSSELNILRGRILWGDSGGTIILSRGGKSNLLSGIIGQLPRTWRETRRDPLSDGIEPGVATARETHRFRIVGRRLSGTRGPREWRDKDDIL